MPYQKNDPPWANGGAPGISAERLNHMETQYDEAKADLDADLGAHSADNTNPHNVTAAQVGAAPASHATDTNNPHSVTATQVGAAQTVYGSWSNGTRDPSVYLGFRPKFVVVMFRASDYSPYDPHIMFRADGDYPYTILIRQISSTIEMLYVYGGASAEDAHIIIQSDGFQIDDGPSMYKGQWVAIG